MAQHSLESTPKWLGGDPHFTFLPGRSHFNVYVEGDDRWALFDQIAAEMYKVARPKPQGQVQSAAIQQFETARRNQEQEP
jgi:hypothetical protein